MAVTTQAPIPRAPVAEPQTDLQGKTQLMLTLPFSIFFRQLRTDVDASARQLITPITIATANASVPTTDLTTPTGDGLYGFQFYAEVLTADAVSSSLTPVLGWTSNGVAKTKSFTAMAGNTTTTTASEAYLIRADVNSPITYALTYVSNTPGAMTYGFYAVLTSVAGVS